MISRGLISTSMTSSLLILRSVMRVKACCEKLIVAGLNCENMLIVYTSKQGRAVAWEGALNPRARSLHGANHYSMRGLRLIAFLKILYGTKTTQHLMLGYVLGYAWMQILCTRLQAWLKMLLFLAHPSHADVASRSLHRAKAQKI